MNASRVGRLETTRLALRPLTIGDVDELVALDADPEVMRYINGGRPTPRAEMATIVQSSAGHRWVAFDKAAGDFVGWFALRPSDAEQHERELGYRLRRKAWGNGCATEGCRA